MTFLFPVFTISAFNTSWRIYLQLPRLSELYCNMNKPDMTTEPSPGSVRIKDTPELSSAGGWSEPANQDSRSPAPGWRGPRPAWILWAAPAETGQNKHQINTGGRRWTCSDSHLHEGVVSQTGVQAASEEAEVLRAVRSPHGVHRPGPARRHSRMELRQRREEDFRKALWSDQS